jgi:hypothetical protein
MYIDGGSGEAVAKLSSSIFWLVLPSLVLFLVLPVMLRSWSFSPSLAASCVATITAYCAAVWVLEQLQVRL